MPALIAQYMGIDAAELARDDYAAPTFGLSDEAMAAVHKDLKGTTGVQVHRELYTYTRNTLHSAVDRVYGAPKYGDEVFDKAFALKQNLSRFTAFKSAWQSAELSRAESSEEVAAINARYNVNWLRTEYLHGVRASRAAVNWERIKADADLYPYIEYMPSMAGEPRNEHKKLYGIIKHITDEFWRTWYPPNDWGCMCSVRQVRSNATSRPMPEKIQAPPPVMRNNPGLSGKIISDQHPMISKVQGPAREKVEKLGVQLENKIIRANSLNEAKERAVGSIYRLSTPEGEITTEALSISRVKEYLNQPASAEAYMVRNYIVGKNFAGLMKNAQYSHSATSTKAHFVKYHYFKTSYNLMLNIAETPKGEMIIWSITNYKAPDQT